MESKLIKKMELIRIVKKIIAGGGFEPPTSGFPTGMSSIYWIWHARIMSPTGTPACPIPLFTQRMGRI